MLESLTDLAAASAWTYALVFAVAALDALFPVVPSEATVIAAGVLAGAGDLDVALVIAAAAFGAFTGDTTSYLLGRTAGGPLTRRYFAAGKRRDRLDATRRLLETRGGYLIVVARFIPGGRTAATLTAGITQMSWTRFGRLAAIAAGIWASYAALLGYAGGRTFEEHPWQGLLAAFALAVAVTGAVELSRHVRSKRVARTSVASCG